jgi:hypothetical protein
MPDVLLWWLVVVNLVTAAAYAYDKLAAPRGGRRVPERTYPPLGTQHLTAIDATACPVAPMKSARHRSPC